MSVTSAPPTAQPCAAAPMSSSNSWTSPPSVNQIATSLSGGERQRVAIARALMRDPALLLVDEPTASLNFELGARVVDALLSEVHLRDKACIMVTHDDRMAQRADRLVEIRDGRVLSDRPLR